MNIICSPGAEEADTGRSLVLLASLSESVSFRFSKGHTQTQSFCPKGDTVCTYTPTHTMCTKVGEAGDRGKGGCWREDQDLDHGPSTGPCCIAASPWSFQSLEWPPLEDLVYLLSYPCIQWVQSRTQNLFLA